MGWITRSRRKRRAASDAGFSLLEVVIAILTITTFLTGTLQLMAVNALYKARAERQARASFWIQEDMEEVKSSARSLNDSAACDPLRGYARALITELSKNPKDNPVKTEKNTKTGTIYQTVGERPFVGRNYTLYRDFPDYQDFPTLALATGAPQNRPHRLRINYRVELTDTKTAKDYQNQETTISTGSFEVIPDASFQCP